MPTLAQMCHRYEFRVRAHGQDVDAKGQPISGRAWPDFHDIDCPNSAAVQGCIGLNQFSTDGNTPTGLSEIDLNSPESPSKLYGPYPVTRFVRGLRGNAQFLFAPSSGSKSSEGGCSSVRALRESVEAPIRSGILVHTGAWANASSWREVQIVIHVRTPACVCIASHMAPLHAIPTHMYASARIHAQGKPMPNSAGCIHAYPEAIRTISRLLVERGVAIRPNTGGSLPYPYRPQGIASVYEVGDVHLDKMAAQVERP